MKQTLKYVNHTSLHWARRHTKMLFVTLGSLVLIAAATTVYIIESNSATNGPHPLLTQRFQPNLAVQQTTVRGSDVIAIRQKANPTGPLLLFFPATGAKTTQYTAFEQTAAQEGYHVIAVPYANLRTERSLCTNNPYCYGDYHRQQLSGEPLARGHPRPDSSIEATVFHSLQLLQKRDPQGLWQNYLQHNTIHWTNVVVAGHSQGGSVSAYIAQQYAMRGVIMLSSPNDINPPSRTVAKWLSSPSRTPKSNYYGFLDTHDVYAFSTKIAWGTMFGPVTITNVDTTKIYTTHFLSTSVMHFPDRLTTHFAVAQDLRYTAVWRYLLDEAM